MAYNFGQGLAGAGAGALSAYNSTGNGYAAIAGGLMGSLSGFTGASSANMMSMEDMYNLEMYNTIKDLYMMNVSNNYNVNNMKLANQLTQSNMKYSSALQKELNADAYRYNLDYLNRQYSLNRKFAEDSYPIATESMRRAGINPILAAGNGAQASVGLPSASAGSVGGSSASSLGVSAPSGRSTNLGDIANALINTYKAKIDKAQLGLNTQDLISNIGLRNSQSAKNLEEAKTQESVRSLNKSQEQFNLIQSIREAIKTSYLPERERAEIDKILAEKEALLGNLSVNQFIAPFQADNLKKTGNSAVTTSKANMINAEANKINAESGNIVKAITDTFKGITGKSPKEVGEAIRKHKYNPVNFYRNNYNGFMDAYRKGQF